MTFDLRSPYQPCGDQPEAIQSLVNGISAGKRAQVLLGVTGSGKTFTIANVIATVQRPTLVIAHNKTLAAQLYQEFKEFFPNNAVEYFVSYYDYYQPEAYLPRTDTYIEKDLAINDRIDRLRLSATRSLLERRDVLIVASVSCIYGLGAPEHYGTMQLSLKVGDSYRRDDLLLQLVQMQYRRADRGLVRSTFRARGELLEIFPAYEEDKALRILFAGDEVEAIWSIDPLTGSEIASQHALTLYPGSHHVTPEAARLLAQESIRAELKERLAEYERAGRNIERERLAERTLHDLAMIREMGFCKGIENYSRHFSNRLPGSPPPCLFDYFPQDYLLIVDESHQTIPQISAMHSGDRARKQSLVEFGFRLPSAFDNRPLSFTEAYRHFHQAIYVSATPGKWEKEEGGDAIVEQLIRPTGLLDPEISVIPAKGQIDRALAEIRDEIAAGGRILVTTLTKKLAEELTQYLEGAGIRAKYLHADVETIERMQIIADLRTGLFDVLVGINLLREGIDLPEVALVLVLEADKEGFLRSTTSLIQICGRAARNERGRVILFADQTTESMRRAIEETDRRRAVQQAYNQAHQITPRRASRTIAPLLPEESASAMATAAQRKEEEHPPLSDEELQRRIAEAEASMQEAARNHRYGEAARYRDVVRKYGAMALYLSGKGDGEGESQAEEEIDHHQA